MNTEIDSGFFEPFRNNIIQIEDGVFTIKVTNAINFDRDIVLKYFDEAIVNYENDGFNKSVTFKCKPKTPEIEQLLLNMFFNPTIIIPAGFSDLFKSPDTD